LHASNKVEGDRKREGVRHTKRRRAKKGSCYEAKKGGGIVLSQKITKACRGRGIVGGKRQGKTHIKGKTSSGGKTE